MSILTHLMRSRRWKEQGVCGFKSIVSVVRMSRFHYLLAMILHILPKVFQLQSSWLCNMYSNDIFFLSIILIDMMLLE